MIFRNNDESFVLQAADTTLRPGLIHALSIRRTAAFVVGLSFVAFAILRSKDVFFYLGTLLLISAMHTDGQIKVLKALDRLSSNNSVQATLASSRA